MDEANKDLIKNFFSEYFNPINILVVAIIIAVLFFAWTHFSMKRVKGKSKPKDPADRFKPELIESTAKVLGVTSSTGDIPKMVYQPFPESKYGERKAVLKMKPVAGQGHSALSSKMIGERLQSLLEAVEVKSNTDGFSVVWEIWYDHGEKPDFLGTPIKWDEKVIGPQDDMSALKIGINDKGVPVRFDTKAHTLLIGASGAGKGSVIWSIIGGLKDNDNVDIYGIDLKGGIEFQSNPAMFRDIGTTPNEAYRILNEMATISRVRASKLGEINQIVSQKVKEAKEKGEDLSQLNFKLHRSWTPGILDPYTVDIDGYTFNGVDVAPYTITDYGENVYLIFDEINAFFDGSVISNKKDVASITGSIIEVLTRGRAAGVNMFAAGQNPRKQFLPSRELFQQTIVLRVKSALDQDMVIEGSSVRTPCYDGSGPEWAYKASPGRGVIATDGGTSYFRAYYPDDQTILSWNKKSK